MSNTQRPKALPHVFMPGQTVTGAISKINVHDVTPEEMKSLLVQYREMNPPANPKPGMRALVPILQRHEARIFGYGFGI
jgi:hypothetical protein